MSKPTSVSALVNTFAIVPSDVHPDVYQVKRADTDRTSMVVVDSANGSYLLLNNEWLPFVGHEEIRLFLAGREYAYNVMKESRRRRGN